MHPEDQTDPDAPVVPDIRSPSRDEVEPLDSELILEELRALNERIADLETRIEDGGSG